MTVFSRTNRGISNQKLFHGNVDFIVYTEGGSKSYSLEEVEQGKYEKSSIDIKFWKNVFNTLNCNKTLEFRAIGSKNAGNDITKKILNNSVNNVLIIKDRDFDDFFNTIVNHDRVIYTKGYSWENDVFTKDLTVYGLKEYLDEDLFQKELKELDELYHELIDKIIKLTRIELFCRKNGISFLTNIKGEALLSDKLTFNYPLIFQIINNNSKMIQRPCRYQKDKFTQNIFLCCYGKFLSIISYRVLNIFIKRKNKYKSISYDAFIKLFMTNFKHNLILNGDVYYKDIVDKVNRL